MMADALRVVLVDDEALVRSGLRLLLSNAPDIEVVAEASNGRDAVATVLDSQPDVVLMDIRMPVMDGIELAHRAHSEFPAMKILLMTGYAEQRERADDLSAKIVDVVSKPFALPDIRKAVASALAG